MSAAPPNRLIIKVIKVEGVELGFEVIDYVIENRNMRVCMEGVHGGWKAKATANGYTKPNTDIRAR